MSKDDVLVSTSSLSRTGTEELLDAIEKILNQSKGEIEDGQ